MENCLFCSIVEGSVPADIIWGDESYVAFRDIDPQAPVHVLVIPRQHTSMLVTLVAAESNLAGGLLAAVAEVAAQEQVVEGGFRTVLNTGVDGGQTVDHVHAHLLGGRQLMWPPG